MTSLLSTEHQNLASMYEDS